MRHINKTISLNSSISKVPGTLSSLAVKSENGNEFIDFVDFTDKDALSSRTLGNYDLIVSDIELPFDIASGITDYTDIYVNIHKPDSDDYYDIAKISKTAIENKYVDGETYYFYYGRDIYSIVWDSETYKDLSIENIVKQATPHKYLSYATLHSWYLDFKKYYAFLNSGNNKIQYNTAIDYYYYELRNNPLENEDTYKHYDDLIKSRGGKKTYDWIKSNCIEIYELPKKFRDANKFSYLYYPQALSFLSFLENLMEDAAGIQKIEDCKNVSSTCCNCMEYIRRGGDELYDGLKKWISNVNANGNETLSASISIPLMFTTNIDDLGEMSIFSNEYQERTDYSSTLDENHKIDGVTGGTVIHRPIITNSKTGNVFVDNNSYMIKDDVPQRKGYLQNKYKENVFNRDDWVDYTVKYINDNPQEFVSNKLYFAYKRDGSIVYNPTSNDMLEAYDAVLFDNGCILYNGNIYEIQKKKYVKYNGLSNSLLNGFLFPVDVSSNGSYYTQINNRVFYASKKVDGNYYFNFTKPNKCHNLSDYLSLVLPKGNDLQKILILNNTLYPLENNASSVTITEYNEITNIDSEIIKANTEYEYKILNGYVIIDDVTYYIIGRKLYTFNGFTLENDVEIQQFIEANPGWIINKRFPLLIGNKVEIIYPYERWRTDIVSGHTDSKLQDLRQTNLLTDDLGNEMPGFYQNTNGHYIQPYEGCLLDMYYKVGNVSQISKNEFLTDDNSYNMQYFDGNILQSMKFYYTIDNKPYYDGAIELTNDMEGSGKTDVLGAIAQCDKNLQDYLIDLDKDLNVDGVTGAYRIRSTQLHCVFTYYMGAILHERIKLNNKGEYEYDGYELASGMNHGVKYVEDDLLDKDKCIYKLTDGTSMFLLYYKIKQNMRNVALNSYNNQLASIYDAQFSAYIRFFKLTKKGEIEVSRSEFNYENGFNQLNNMAVTPVFRKNYDFGITFSQNVNSDIYIDRGINRAFDKHLRLQEIKNMEALENYQNGSIFNIIEG